jgi:ADP-ribosylglycohydrolase
MNAQKNKRRSMLLGSLYGDAFALGPHWVYDTDLIQSAFGHITSLTNPMPNSYHQGKRKGDFTHYGDQTLFFLAMIKESNGFDLEAATAAWAEYMENYSGYMDQATRETLANIQNKLPNPAGSNSHDLAGAARIAPFLYVYNELDELLLKVKEQTAMTHNNNDVIDTALFFAKTCYRVLEGEAVETVIISEYDALPEGTIKKLIGRGIAEKGRESIESLKSFGTTCLVPDSLPGTIQIILTQTDNFINALSSNVMAGGDSAARGLLIGMILGAALDIEPDFFKEMNKYKKIEALL